MTVQDVEIGERGEVARLEEQQGCCVSEMSQAVRAMQRLGREWAVAEQRYQQALDRLDELTARLDELRSGESAPVSCEVDHGGVQLYRPAGADSATGSVIDPSAAVDQGRSWAEKGRPRRCESR